MPGFWEQLLDYFTRVDDILRQFKEEYAKGNRELIAAVKGEEPAPPIPVRHVPFYLESVTVANTPFYILVKDDAEQGLGVTGRSGFVLNDGADSLYITIESVEGKSNAVRIDGNETLFIERDDNIWVDKLTLFSRIPVVFRCLFSG